MAPRSLFVGSARKLDGVAASPRYDLYTHELVTHAAVLGMTGSGKTGLVIALVEEALGAGVPVLMIDIKGDLPNLLLGFPSLSAGEFLPWVDAEAAEREGATPEAKAEALAATWTKGLAASGLVPSDVARLKSSIAPRLITPGAQIGEPLHVLSSLEHPSALWHDDEEAAHDALAASLSLALQLAGKSGDPKSREHVVLTTLAERRLRAGQAAGLAVLLGDVMNPPIATIGAMPFDDFFPDRERKALAQDLNALLASPKLASWLRGAPLDVTSWMKPKEGKTPAVIVSVAHLDDEARQQVLGLLLEEVLAYVRGQAGTSELRALVVFDEVFGFLPPHPASPPTKKPLLALLKQARAFGVGIVVATQNPMDVDYKALSNAGLWFVGRLSTDADRQRVVEGLVGADGGAGLDAGELGNIVKALPKRSFFVRNVHKSPSVCLVETRFCMSYLRGPMTRRELARLAKELAPIERAAPAAAASGAQPAGVEAAPATAGAEPQASLSAATAAASPSPAPARSSSAPSLPPGFRHFHAPAGSAAEVRYEPYLACTALVRVREPSLGVSEDRSISIVVPLVDGRPELSRAAEIDPRGLTGTPAARASYAELPPGFATKKNGQALERALRDHVIATTTIDVRVHPELGLAQRSDELYEAFVARCAQVTEAGVAAQRQAAQAKAAPKLAALRTKLAAAERAYHAAYAAKAQAPSPIGAALAGFIPGAKRASSQMLKAHGKADAALEKAQAAYTAAQNALREAEAALAAELAHAESLARARAGAIEVRRLGPAKKAGVELTAVGVAWSPAG